ncbi:MAG: TrkH family potassium uptake protein [Phycisphaeraceae bacterium]
MNHRFVANQLGLLLLVLSGLLVALALYEFAEYLAGTVDELTAIEATLSAAGVGVVFGTILWWYGRGRSGDIFGRREALLLVALTWFLGTAIASLPFYFWAHLQLTADQAHPFKSFINCYFEAMSGLTTTGATVLSDIEALPRGILLWRALTQWLGGLGIVVLFVAVLPTLGVMGKRLFHVEVSGPTHGGVRPRIRDTAAALWVIYVALTAAQVVSLRLCGMPWFDAACHAFTTLATGGFSPHNASLGGYASTAINLVTIVFMVLAGVNFGLYYQLTLRSAKNFFRDTELRVYLATMLIATVAVTVILLTAGDPITTTDGRVIEARSATTVVEAAFQVSSIQTSTGFATSNYDTWPFAAKAILLMMMFVGGCAGSTAGGIKIIRVWIAIKVILAELERAFSPHVVRPLRVGKTTIDPDLRIAILSYVIGIVALFGLGAFTIMVFEGGEASFTTAASASAATLFVVGPGFHQVGAIENYGWMTDATKIFLSFWMLLGRLEVFALAVLLMPRFWRG